MPALKMATEKEIPIIVLSQCNQGRTQMKLYQVGVQALEAGAIPGGDMTLEAAATKLMWILAYTKDMKKIRQLFSTNVAGEVTTANKL